MDIYKSLSSDFKKIAVLLEQTKPDTARGKLLLFMFLFSITAFSIQRFVIYFSLFGKFSEIGVNEIAKAFAYGFRFDLVITCTLLVPLVLMFVFVPSKYNLKKYISIPISIYGGLFSALVVFSCIADYYFFQEFGKRLNHQVINYIEYDYIYKIIINQYQYVLVLIITLIVFVIFSRLIYKYIFLKQHYIAGAKANAVWSLLALAALIISIRGSLGPKSINTGLAYFNESNSLAQLTLNGLFTLRESGRSMLIKDTDLGEKLDLLPQTEALSITKELLQTSQDDFFDRPENPLWRKTDTGKPRKDYNVVLVIMESLAWPYIGAMGGVPDLTPNLDNLIENGVLMDHCFSVGHRTTYAFSGIVCGYPDLPEVSITTRQLSEGNFLTLGSILKKRGYKTMFIYGGQPYYDHRQSFLGSNGFSEFVFEDHFPQKTFRTHLGWCDEDLFAAAHETFQKQDKPFFAVLLTLAFHRDYKIPKGKVELNSSDHSHQEQKLAIKYTDWAIGQYMEKAKKSDYFDNTIFIFVADHCGGFLNTEPKPTAFRVPFLIYAPKILETKEKRISKICSQTDIAPTIMSLLGGSYSHSFFGSNVFGRKPNEGRALIEPGDGILAYIDGNGEMVTIPLYRSSGSLLRFQSPDKLITLDKNLPQNSKTLKRLQKEAIAILQTADFLYNEQSYRYP